MQCIHLQQWLWKKSKNILQTGIGAILWTRVNSVFVPFALGTIFHFSSPLALFRSK
jgi:hypothetical protein